MGFNIISDTINLAAKLTPIGRKKLITNTNLLITSFSLGDSDACYYTSLPLPSGFVPAAGGNIGAVNTPTNSVGPTTELRSKLYLNNTGALTKAVEVESNEISTERKISQQVSYSGALLTHNVVTKDFQSDPLSNLFYSFGLPITQETLVEFSATTYSNGGYSDTIYSGFTGNSMLVIGIDNDVFGETIDGKSIKVSLTNLNGVFDIYGTYEDKGKSLSIEDSNISETSASSKAIGTNVVFLFCDSIQKPNNNASLSWATGTNAFKPFSQSGKQLFNFVTDVSQAKVADKCVGVAYLDKGFIVITNQSIVENFYPISYSGSTIVSFKNVTTSVMQNITCLANRGEFGVSTNETFEYGDEPRITEVALYDNDGDMIALAKADRHVTKSVNEFLAFGINITL